MVVTAFTVVHCFYLDNRAYRAFSQHCNLITASFRPQKHLRVVDVMRSEGKSYASQDTPKALKIKGSPWLASEQPWNEQWSYPPHYSRTLPRLQVLPWSLLSHSISWLLNFPAYNKLNKKMSPLRLNDWVMKSYQQSDVQCRVYNVCERQVWTVIVLMHSIMPTWTSPI